jgi:5'-deoxynucleotidase YfbR-like HD superfamily hydrolase
MITNYKSKNIDLFNFTEEDFCIEDVVIGLSNICRYGGRVNNFFSVAQHSVILSRYLRLINKEYLCPLAILHDAPEVYIGDIIYPIKSLFPEFLKFENALTNIVYSKFNLDIKLHKEFNYYDKNIVVNEMKSLGIWDREKYLCSNLKELPNLTINKILSPIESKYEYIKELLLIFPNLIVDL